MKTKELGVISLLVAPALFVFGILIGLQFGTHLTNKSWHQILIEKGLGQYNLRTGEWEFKDDKADINIDLFGTKNPDGE